MSTDPAAMAIAWTERARAALDEARGWRACAEAFVEREDPVADTWHADMRREGYRHLLAVADGLESYADRCREAARANRRARYDNPPSFTGIPNTVTHPRVTLAEDVARRNGGAA